MDGLCCIPCYKLTTCNHNQSAAMKQRDGLCVWNPYKIQMREQDHTHTLLKCHRWYLRSFHHTNSNSNKRNVVTRCQFYRMLLTTNWCKYCPQQATWLDCDIARGGRWAYRFLRHLVLYIPRNMHTVFALMCFVVVIHWLIYPYPSGLLHWHCGNLTIALVPTKQPWWIWINTSCEFIMNDCITTRKQSTTKPCAYFLGYTVLTYFAIRQTYSPIQIDVAYTLYVESLWVAWFIVY